MADEAPSTKPAPKQPAQRTQQKRTWSVYEQFAQVDVFDADVVSEDAGELPPARAEGATVLVLVDADVEARTGSEACWHIAEGQLRDRAIGEDRPMLCASRNGTGTGLTEPKPYGIKTTHVRDES
jgi:hypothetical protein